MLSYPQRCSRASSDICVESSIPNRQSFSHTYVEKKRYHRTLTAVINGVPVAEAIRQGLVEPDDEESPGLELDEAVGEDDQSMFVPETKPTPPTLKPSPSGPALNPEASTFTPKFGESQGSSSSVFGRPAEKSTSSFGQPTSFGSSGFGSSGLSTGFGSASTASMFGKPAVGQPQPGSFSFGGFGQTPKEPASNSPNLAAPSTSQTQAPALSSNPVTTPTFTGFNFGHAATASSTAAPAPSAVASTSSAIPPIFGPRATFPPSGPAEGNVSFFGSLSDHCRCLRQPPRLFRSVNGCLANQSCCKQSPKQKPLQQQHRSNSPI